jgi:hypothetical protein
MNRVNTERPKQARTGEQAKNPSGRRKRFGRSGSGGGPNQQNRPKHNPQKPAQPSRKESQSTKLEAGQTPDGRRFGSVVESHKPKRYGILFFDTFQQAKADPAKLQDAAREFDQLNIVIKAEGDMNDPELRQYGMLYAGAAWHLIHTRRQDEGWYSAPR